MKRANSIERRRFLKLSIAGASGAALFSSYKPGSPKSKKKTKVVYRTLGRTGVKLPIVSMGAMRGENRSLLDAGIKMGVKHFDTAYVYQNGKNEEMVGDVMTNHKRKSIFVATKIVPEDKDRKTGELGPGSTAEKFLEKLDVSLERLRMDYVDLLYVHSISTRDGVLNPEMIKAVKEAKRLGKAKFIGVSTHKNEPEVLEAMIEAGVYDVALVAFNFKQDHRELLKATIAKAADKGIGIVAMKTMAGGFLDKEKTKPVNTKAALKWVMQDENICTCIPGFTSFEQLEESFSIMDDLNITDEEQSDLDAALVHAGLFCDQCGICTMQCKKSLPVNEFMRAYMYNYGYREAAKAKTLLSNLSYDDNPCGDCNLCTVRCPKQFAVADKIKDVSRLVSIPDDFIT